MFCQRDPSDPKEEPQVVDSSQCSEEKPPATLTCRFDPCLDGSNAHSMVEVEVCFMCWETFPYHISLDCMFSSTVVEMEMTNYEVWFGDRW